MSLTPYLVRSFLDDLETPMNLWDQNFGVGLLPRDLMAPRSLYEPLSLSYYRPWRHTRGADSGVSNVVDNNNEFQVNLDVQQFKPEELNVKTIDQYVLVEGKHEERKDEHGFVSRQFQRRYRIPSNVDPSQVKSALSSDGVLTISAPKKAKPLPENERNVAIVQTKQPAIKDKETNKPNKANKPQAAQETMEQ